MGGHRAGTHDGSGADLQNGRGVPAGTWMQQSELMSPFPRLRRPLLVLSMMAAGSIVLAACSPSPTRPVSSPPAAAAAQAKVAARSTPGAPPVISVVPADGTTNVALDTQVTVKTDSGSIDAVVVHPANDHTAFLTGTLDRTGRIWTSTQPLDSGMSYVVDVTAHDEGGDQSTARTTFTTTTPTTTTAIRLITDSQPSDGDTVGIAMPITLHFNVPVDTDKQANLVSHLQVASVPPQAGAWHWFAPTVVHYRPQEYWQPGSKVTLSAHLRGVGVGNNAYGQGDWSMSFTVGQKHASTIDAAAHTMTVSANDQTLYTWPISAGRPQYPTIQGNLVVWFKQYDVFMDSGSIGIPEGSADGYAEDVYWDTAISTDGYFIHSAPWSVAQQGSQNVSHGCVNLSPEHAQTFFNFSQKGDLVIVLNTGLTATASDGEGDWQIPFAQYANSGGTTSLTPAPQQPGGL